MQEIKNQIREHYSLAFSVIYQRYNLGSPNIIFFLFQVYHFFICDDIGATYI